MVWFYRESSGVVRDFGVSIQKNWGQSGTVSAFLTFGPTFQNRSLPAVSAPGRATLQVVQLRSAISG
jgi:hypothetical protein